MNQQTGKYIILAGVVIVIIGALIYFFNNKLKWLGRLPGDIRIEKDKYHIYFPLATMLLISIVFTIIVNVIKRFL